MSTCYCLTCGDSVSPLRAERWATPLCLTCGEEAAREQRMGWCIAPIAHKQGATLVTNKADLRGLNKQER
jgi:hypothetical protein